MYRQEYFISVNANPSVATFIKHMCKMHLCIPKLTLGIVMTNTTTSINEEWLTVIESLPSHKIFYDYIYDILTMKYNFCIHLKKTQKETDTYISLADFNYYVITPDEVIELDIIKELKETLVHSFSEYRESNVRTIELVAFSSGTIIDVNLINRLKFLDPELFNKEYNNVKVIHSTKLDRYLPFSVIAPEGNLKFFMERYPWCDNKSYMRAVLYYLKEVVKDNISKFNIVKTSITKETVFDSSVYDPFKKIIFTNDIITMCAVNFAGCECQLGTFHKFDIDNLNIKKFHKEINKTITEIYNAVN
ncbi:SWPV1-240 [Shearwaterpox virus]|uniref:DNA-directed RNA polymerase 35 kDa subunit n=1 Tax=Shearwaterpox virus TaxID=1974596 RepID=A0A1V0QGX6_CNPV|nr:SWPV1-240 [Shearwaterpox virus]